MTDFSPNPKLSTENNIHEIQIYTLKDISFDSLGHSISKYKTAQGRISVHLNKFDEFFSMMNGNDGNNKRIIQMSRSEYDEYLDKITDVLGKQNAVIKKLNNCTVSVCADLFPNLDFDLKQNWNQYQTQYKNCTLLSLTKTLHDDIDTIRANKLFIENTHALVIECVLEIDADTEQLDALDKNLSLLWDNLKCPMPEHVNTIDEKIFAQRLEQCMEDEMKRNERKKARQASKHKPRATHIDIKN